MNQWIVLSLKEANLLRKRLRLLLKLRQEFLDDPKDKTIHDLRVASRRTREVLDYCRTSLPDKWHGKIKRLAKRITEDLGPLREAEVNTEILKRLLRENDLEAAGIEALIHSQTTFSEAHHEEAVKEIASKKFDKCDAFLKRLHGSRKLQPGESEVLQERSEEFLAFQWTSDLTDEKLHDLRIRTKKFRYAVEIYDRLHARNLGHFLRRVKNLQEVLGQIHDLFVLGESVRKEIASWQSPGLSIIPAALQQSLSVILLEKTKLYPRVYPYYSRIIENAPSQLTAFQKISPQASSDEPEPRPVQRMDASHNKTAQQGRGAKA